MRRLLIVCLTFITCLECLAVQNGRDTISLNGTWSFDQTVNAFPPKKYTRTIPVPGLITLAEPKVSQYEKYYEHYKDLDKVPYCRYKERGYVPMYNWYNKKITFDSSLKDKNIVLNILKSMYVTSVYVNGNLVTTAKECSTPIVCDITKFVQFDKENDITIMVGDRAFLPSDVAGCTDVEKFQYISGIWDDVFITTPEHLFLNKVLFLPSVKNNQVNVKTLLQNLDPSERLLGNNRTTVDFSMDVRIKEKKSGKVVATTSIDKVSRSGHLEKFETSLDVAEPHVWSPEDPFLYVGEIDVKIDGKVVDNIAKQFGIREFSVNGRYFDLNGQRYLLRGSNITLHRFFEDPECGNLPWDREWVKKMLIDDPKAIDWNAMRICVGLVPDFWYDLCDEYGLALQNEWMYWQLHGWDEQIRKEYTDWVWSDGNHPSIVIWDAINENVNDYIGNVLIPELKELDPTRVWDAGYMLDSHDDIDEPHTYIAVSTWADLNTEEKLNNYFKKSFDKLGTFDYWNYFTYALFASIPQLVNEYGWVWLNRDGGYTALSRNNYRYYVGDDATPDERREFQAYILQTESEWLRSQRNLAGLLPFCTLTNNYGKTGDWYMNRIKDLEQAPAYKWFKHCFAKAAVFINLADSRYQKTQAPLTPGDEIAVELVGVNDEPANSKGNLSVNIYNSDGEKVYTVEKNIEIRGYENLRLPTILKIPSIPGGYLITAEYTPEGKDTPYISRRFVKVGNADTYKYYDLRP